MKQNFFAKMTYILKRREYLLHLYSFYYFPLETTFLMGMSSRLDLLIPSLLDSPILLLNRALLP